MGKKKEKKYLSHLLKHSCLDSTPKDCDSAGLQQGPWICIPSRFPWGCCGYCWCVPHTLKSTAWLLCSISRLNNDRSTVRMTAFLRATLCGCIACALSNCTWNLRGWGGPVLSACSTSQAVGSASRLCWPGKWCSCVQREHLCTIYLPKRYVYARVCVCSATHLCPILCDHMTIACQAPLSMGLPGPEYWSGLPFLLQGIFVT